MLLHRWNSGLPLPNSKTNLKSMFTFLLLCSWNLGLMLPFQSQIQKLLTHFRFHKNEIQGCPFKSQMQIVLKWLRFYTGEIQKSHCPFKSHIWIVLKFSLSYRRDSEITVYFRAKFKKIINKLGTPGYRQWVQLWIQHGLWIRKGEGFCLIHPHRLGESLAVLSKICVLCSKCRSWSRAWAWDKANIPSAVLRTVLQD